MTSLALNVNNANIPVTMTSLELVEFINSHRKDDEAVLQHRDFMAKVPKVLGEGVCENFRTPYIHPQNGQTYCIFKFPKREACLMAMSYSYDLQAKVFDRMTELESQVMKPALSLPNFTDPAEAAIAWAAEFKAKQLAQVQIVALENKLTEIQPDIDAFSRIAKAEGSLCVRDAANNLQVRPKELQRVLIAHGWIYKRNGNDAWHGYQDKLQAGYLEHKSTTVKASDGVTDKIVEQVRITPKGLTKLAKLFVKGEMV